MIGALLQIVLGAGGGPADTVRVPLAAAPPRLGALDSASLGPPQVRVRTGQGEVQLWLLRTADSAYVAAAIPDSTPYWGDDLVIGLDTSGDGGPAPRHNDFEWDLRRTLDSSVIYRGRDGRWEPPRADPDWRLGPARDGGGWRVSGADGPHGWQVVLGLDRAWFVGANGRLPAIAFRIYDDAPSGRFSWPQPAGRPAGIVEDTPGLWAPVRAGDPP